MATKAGKAAIKRGSSQLVMRYMIILACIFPHQSVTEPGGSRASPPPPRTSPPQQLPPADDSLRIGPSRIRPSATDTDDLIVTMFAAGPGGTVDVERGGRPLKVSLKVPHALKLRADVGGQGEAVWEDGGAVSLMEAELGEGEVLDVQGLHLRHKGGRFEVEDLAEGTGDGGEGSSSGNSTVKNGMLGGCCCIGVEGGEVGLSECTISAAGGSCVGATGPISKATLRCCKLTGSSVGVVGCEGARVRCEDTSMEGHDQAGIVLMGNGTLAEVEGCSIDDCRVMGASVTGGSRLVVEGCSFEGNNQTGVGVSGLGGFLQLRRSTLMGNGEHGILVADCACAQIENCRIGGHEYGVTCMDHGSSIWAEANNLQNNTKEEMCSGVGGVIEFPGGTHRGPDRTPSPERRYDGPEDGNGPVKEEDMSPEDQTGKQGGRGSTRESMLASIPCGDGNNVAFECEDLTKGVSLDSADDEERDGATGLEPRSKKPRPGG